MEDSRYQTVRNKYGERNFEYQNTHKALVETEQNVRFNGHASAWDCMETKENKRQNFKIEKDSWEKLMDKTQ